MYKVLKREITMLKTEKMINYMEEQGFELLGSYGFHNKFLVFWKQDDIRDGNTSL